MNSVSSIVRSEARSNGVVFRDVIASQADHMHSRARELVEWRISQGLRPNGEIDRLVKEGRPPSFEEVLEGMIYVLAASNMEIRALVEPALIELFGDTSIINHDSLITKGASFLQLMACREVFLGLRPEEVAALAVAGLADCVTHLELDEVVETCGMGADRGFGAEFAGYKTINASTLSAIVVAAMGTPAIKHGSYGNTAKVGSTDAAKILGLPMTFQGGTSELMEYWRKHHFLYLEAYVYKTIHDLSHLIKHETVNHLVGPMSVPVSSDTLLHKLIGVNHNVDPAVVVQGYNQLESRGIQRIGGVLAICGLSASAPDSLDDYLQHVVLDELSPYRTLVAAGTGDVFHGCFFVTHEDFGMPAYDASDIQIRNEHEDLAVANERALRGQDPVRSRYLAANAALALATKNADLDALVQDVGERRTYLTSAYECALDVIMSGEAWRFTQRCSRAE